MIVIDPARLARLNDPSVRLSSGNGSGIDGIDSPEACVMNWAHFLAGRDGSGDSHPCVDDVIRNFCIGLNDASHFAQWRDELKPYAARVLNTAAGTNAESVRAYMCADWAVRTIAPRACDFWAEVMPERATEAHQWATKLRSCVTIFDAQSAEAGRAVARNAANAANAAYAAANAAAYAAYAAAADAAYAAANAAAYAAANAAYVAADAADAAAYAAANAAARSKDTAFAREMWDASLAFLDRLIAVTA